MPSEPLPRRSGQIGAPPTQAARSAGPASRPLSLLRRAVKIVSINLLQHQDCDFDSRFDHSRNWTGKMLNWCLFNNGFHTAHHLYPGAHWSQLPKLHDRRVARHISPSLIETSLVASVWRRFVTGEDWRGSRK